VLSQLYVSLGHGANSLFGRIIDAPRHKVFKAWTDPKLLKQWFAPLPYTTPVARTGQCADQLAALVPKL
jgi:uncharacterized protein YndB with AHSA1/START domain